MNLVASSSGVTIGSISFVLIIILFIIMYLFIKTARVNRQDDLGENGRENLLNQYLRRRQEKRLLKRQAKTEEDISFENVSQSATVMRAQRPFHSTPNTPTPQTRGRSNTESSSIAIPHINIISPELCQYHTTRSDNECLEI